MRGAMLTGKRGLFPFGVTQVGIRCIDDELFGWVQYARKFDERFVALPPDRASAQEMLAARLLADFGFTTANAVKAAELLFDQAFKDAGGKGLPGDSLCEGLQSVAPLQSRA